MKLTQLIRNEILAKYGEGQIFTKNSFAYENDGQRITSILSIMRKNGFIEKVGTEKPTNKFASSINKYKLAGTSSETVALKDVVTLSQWHTYPIIPVHNGFYEVMYYDNKKAKVEWNGKWHLPIPYIKGWRGIAKNVEKIDLHQIVIHGI